MTYRFLTETYDTERIKILSVWSQFVDEDLPVRPHPSDPRGRSVREQMVHQLVSEDLWFKTMLGIDVDAPPLPETETRREFISRYAEDSARRLSALKTKSETWWQETVDFFEVPRTRAWIFLRRIAHSAHHRGQQTALLRMIGRDLHSTYGPTADTGGLMQDKAPVIYPYADLESLLSSGPKASLPGPGAKPVTERPAAVRSGE